MYFYTFPLGHPEAWYDLFPCTYICIIYRRFCVLGFCKFGFAAEFSCVVVLLVWDSVFYLAELLSVWGIQQKCCICPLIGYPMESIPSVLFILVTEGEFDRDFFQRRQFLIYPRFRFVAVAHEEVLSAVTQAWLVIVSIVLRLPWSLGGPCKVKFPVVKHLSIKTLADEILYLDTILNIWISLNITARRDCFNRIWTISTMQWVVLCCFGLV